MDTLVLVACDDGTPSLCDTVTLVITVTPVNDPPIANDDYATVDPFDSIQVPVEINDSDLAFTAAWGFWALILLAIIASIIKQPELAKYSIYYGIWNLHQISQLDGTKLFFGLLINWLLLIIVYVISLFFI